MKEKWSDHSSFGTNITASLPREKIIEHKVVVTGVDPELDDTTLKAEIEERNNLKLTSLARLHNRETRTKT